MMQNGARPTKRSRKDLDLHRSFGNVLDQVEFPTEFFTTKDTSRPNQIKDKQPFGCTNYSQWRLATNLGIKNITPIQLEMVTHANAKGGIDIRESLLACTPPKTFHPERLGWFKAFYNIQAKGILDWFDAFRLAQISGLPEQRSITWGTPWFPSWENAINGVLMQRNPDGTYVLLPNPKGKQVVMQMPTDAELAVARKDSNSLPWHNSELDGWTLKHGPLTYRDESWQGPEIGEGGMVFFPREVINIVMALDGTVAYTGTNQTPENPATVDWKVVDYIVNFITNLLTKIMPQTPEPSKSDMLKTFCTALMNFEGKPGDLNYINNNPGNFRCSAVGYLPKYGDVKCRNRFAVFPTFELGWEYLLASVHHRAALHPDWTILDFFNSYAPSSDNNPTKIYANTVAKACGVPVTTTLKELFG